MKLGMSCILGFVLLLLVIWHCGSVIPGGSTSRRRMDQERSSGRSGGKMDWSDCRPDLMGNFLGRESTGEVNREASLSTEDGKEKAVVLQPSNTRSAFVDCLSEQNLPILVSGEEGNHPRNWFVKYLELLLGWNAASRRQLADETSRSVVPIPATAPAPSLPSAPAPSPLATTLPVNAPAPSPIFAPVTPPMYGGPSPAESPEQISQLIPDADIQTTPPDVAMILPPENSDGSKRTVIIAIILAATGSMLFTAILFYCYSGRHFDSGNGHRDDKPLLALGSSNFSAGSSHKSFELKNSVSRGSIESQSFQREASHDREASDMFSSHAEVPSSDTILADASSPGVVVGMASFSVEPAATATVIPTMEPPPRPPPPPLMPPPGKKSAPPPHPPLPPLSVRPGPVPPPPPKGAPVPRRPQEGLSSARPPSVPGPNRAGTIHSDQSTDSDGPKTKLKPFFWDKVLANPDQSMVWHQINSGSFQFNEEMIETLFGYSAGKQKNGDEKKPAAIDTSPQHIQILDPKKSQNLAILLRALNVTVEEVRDALIEGNELPTELLQTLIKMAPTTDEELKLRLYGGEVSCLGPAERFLKALVDIPFAFKRLDAMLFMGSLQEEISSIKNDFQTIEAACEELKNSRLFKKLLEAVVKIGNRMNDGTYRGGARAFKLDTLLKLADVKGADGKTTLLHFVVQEIVLSEGIRADRQAAPPPPGDPATPSDSRDRHRRLGLEVVSGLPSELENVKKAALLDADALAGGAAALGRGLLKTRSFLNGDMRSMEEESGFHRALRSFVEDAEGGVTALLEEEKRARLLVKRTVDFFHGEAGRDEGLRLFGIVRDFLGMLEKACREVREAPATAARVDPERSPAGPRRQRPFPPIGGRRADSSSSDDGSP